MVNEHRYAYTFWMKIGPLFLFAAWKIAVRAEQARNLFSGRGVVRGCEKIGYACTAGAEQEQVAKRETEQEAGVTEIGLSGERKFCCCRSAHMLCRSIMPVHGMYHITQQSAYLVQTLRVIANEQWCKDISEFFSRHYTTTCQQYQMCIQSVPNWSIGLTDLRPGKQQCTTSVNEWINKRLTFSYNTITSKVKWIQQFMEIITPLREITCHMGSHSVTCHSAVVTFAPLPHPKLELDKATQRDAMLSWPG